MARGAPTFSSGTLATAVDGSQVETLYDEVVSQLTSYQSNGTDAWELYDTVGTRDRVYRSVGDRTLASGAGDAALFIRITQSSTTAIQFRGYQDWSDVSSTGSRGTSANVNWPALNAYGEARFWAVGNEYEFAVLIRQENDYYFAHFGSTIRSHVPSEARGIAFTTASATAGSSVTVNLDRNITSQILDSGATNGPQRVWIYNITPSGAALRSATVEIAEVTTIASGSITFASLANSFDSGAIVGLDPCPLHVNTALNSAFSVIYYTNAINGTYLASTTQTADYELFDAGVAGPSFSPDALGLLRGGRAIMSVDQTGLSGFRGTSEIVSFVTSGPLVDGDFFRPAFSTANQYMVFPSLLVNGQALALGPGAA